MRKPQERHNGRPERAGARYPGQRPLASRKSEDIFSPSGPRAKHRGQAATTPSTSTTAGVKLWRHKGYASSAPKGSLKRGEGVLKSPTEQARSAPKHGWKTAADALSKCQVIPLHPEDCHLTAVRPKLRPRPHPANALQATLHAGNLEIIRSICASLSTVERLPTRDKVAYN